MALGITARATPDITPFRVLDLPAALREGRENQAGKYRNSTTRSSTLVSHNKDNATAQDYRVADCDLDTCYHPYDQTFAFAEASRVFAYPEPDTASLHVAGFPGVLELYPGTWAAIFLEPRVPKEETGETLYFSMSTHDDPAIGPVVLDLDPGAVFEVDEDVDGESFGHFGYWVDDAGGNVVLLYMSDKQGGNVLRRAVSALPTSSATQLDFTRRCTTPSDQFVTLPQQPFCDPLGMLNASGKTLHDPTIDPEPTPEDRRRLYIIDSGTNVMAFDFETDGTDPQYRGRVLWPDLVKADLDERVASGVLSEDDFHPADQVCQLKDPSVVHPDWALDPTPEDRDPEPDGYSWWDNTVDKDFDDGIQWYEPSTQDEGDDDSAEYPEVLLFTTVATTDIYATATADGTVSTTFLDADLTPDGLNGLRYSEDADAKAMKLADLLQVLPNEDGTGPAEEFSCLRFCTAYWDGSNHVLNLEGRHPMSEDVSVECFLENHFLQPANGGSVKAYMNAAYKSADDGDLYDYGKWVKDWPVHPRYTHGTLVFALSSTCRSICRRRSILVAGASDW